MAKIYIKFNSAIIKEIPLKKDEFTFGRKPNNDIPIDNPAISGFHGRIVKEGNQFYVEDLNSTNGTFLNGQRIKKTALKNKDQIGVARHVLEFVTEDQPSAPVESVAPPSTALEKNKQMDMLRQSMGIASSTDKATEIPSAKLTPPAPIIAISVPAPSPTPTPRPAPSADPALSDMAPNNLPAPNQVIGNIRIVSGAVNGQSEIPLKDLVTYIGTSEKATIKIKGLMAPGLAAAISRKPEGYFLKAIKPGYPKVNGKSVDEQTLLENGTLLELGGTNMIFSIPTPKNPQK